MKENASEIKLNLETYVNVCPVSPSQYRGREMNGSFMGKMSHTC